MSTFARLAGIATALIASALLLFTVGNAQAMTTDQATQAARDAGFPGQVYVFEVDEPNGMYSPSLQAIALWQPAGFPDRWMLVILYHEIGHWQQDVTGVIHALAPVDREWDADVRGARLGCERGIGLADIAALWSWMYEQSGNADSPSHGRLLYRAINVIQRAGAPCGRTESPWQASTTTTTALDGVSRS
jgi:hypothetical protein